MKYENVDWKYGEDSPVWHAIDIMKDCPDLYNKVSMYLYKLFGDKIVGAQISAIVTLAIIRDREGWFDDGKNEI